MAIRDLLRKSISKDAEFKEMQKQDRMQTMLEDRKKGANERELERFYEEERQKMIKQNLEEFRKKKQDEFIHGEQILNAPNIFKNSESIMKEDFKILDNGKGVLGGKKIFKIGKGKNHGKGGMFFK